MRNRTVREISALERVGQHRVSPNLYVQVKPGGTRSWLFRYMRQGKPHWLGLGPVELVTLAEARAKVLNLRRGLLDGVDPLAARGRPVSPSFADCAARYIAAHQDGWRNGKHRAQWAATLETYVYPVLGDLPVAAVDTGAVMQVLEPIWRAKPETASRVRGRIESVLDWAAARDHRAGDNPARWRGHLQNLLPARAKVAPVEHHKAMSYADLPAFMAALQRQAGTGARCLELTILTAARTGETTLARWSEVDLGAELWRVPAARMKAGKDHVVPLSAPALALLAELPRFGSSVDEPNVLLFEGARAGRPLSNKAMLMLLRRMGRGDLTVHGFRSTFRDWAAEQTSYANHVVEMALAHVIGDKVEAAYRRGDLLEKRRELMAEWAAYAGRDL